MTARPAPLTTLTSGLLVAVATLPLRDVFGDWSWVVAVMGASLLGAAVAGLTETVRRDLPLSVIAAITAVGGALWALMVPLGRIFFENPLGARPWTELRDGVFDGWGALLEEQFPLTDPRSAETFATVLAWIAAAAAVHVAARRRTALAGMGASATVLWISSAAALPRGLTPSIFGAGAGMMALFAITTITRSTDQRWRLGRLMALLAVVGLAGGAAMLATAASGSLDREPLDPRASRDTEVAGFEVPDILAEFGVRRMGDETVMTIDMASFPASLRLRLQVYDTHDGERWLPATGFEEVAIFPEPEILPPGEVVTFAVSIEDLDGPWLPLPDRLISIDLNDIRWNEETQTALDERETTRVELTGTEISRAGLDGQPSARDAVAAELSQVPASLPDAIREIAADAAAGATDAATTIDAIKARLRELGRDEAVAPGHSFGRLERDLSDGTATGAEQIASLHALMLRAVGIPSRVVVGYVATAAVVEPSDLHVWTEVPFPGIGWVPFDPVPSITETSSENLDEPTVTSTTLPQEPTLQARALPRELGPGEDPDEPDIGLDPGFTRRDAALLVLLLVGAALAGLVGIRMLRRRLRGSTTRRSDIRVLGAWAELVDRLRELGAPITSTTTIDDIVFMAATIDEELGGHARAVGDLASIARYSPDRTRTEEAALAWEELREAETRLSIVRGRHTQARRYLDPRVLRYRAPAPPPTRDGRRPRRIRERSPQG